MYGEDESLAVQYTQTTERPTHKDGTATLPFLMDDAERVDLQLKTGGPTEF